MAKSRDTSMQEILKGISEGTTRLPDFQRGWVWDDERIRALIASITCSHPIGAVMFLEYGGDNIRFKSSAFTGVLDNGQTPDKLVLDGQQRLTSVYCAMHSEQPVQTQTIKNEEIQRYYYLDIVKCLDPGTDRIDAVISVPADKIVREDFGRKIVLDLREPNGEFQERLFPLNIVYNFQKASEWKNGYREFHNYDRVITSQLDCFENQIHIPIIQYTLPVIELDKTTPKEAVCQVFENVNTGGVSLTVFELVTASFAADDFPLRKDWEMRREKMKQAEGTINLLSVVSETDFLVSLTLLSQVKRNRTLTCKRKDVLSLTLDDYKLYKDDLTEGYIKAAHFLVEQNILKQENLPYTSQFVPLSVLLTILGKKAEDERTKSKLATWYWCGVFGEMYGASNETRYANDVSGVLTWLDGGNEPDTVSRAFFQPTRLLSLQTRNGAAYKGVMALILNEGARDFISGSEMDFKNFIAENIDIHHIFPRKYCESKGYDKNRWNCIVNKTPISYRTNRIIGGKAPSEYMKELEKKVSSPDTLDGYVISHGIDVIPLRQDDFDTFFASRERKLLELISKAMGKPVVNN